LSEELEDELERLRKENEALKKRASSGIRMKVSEKGAVSIYGMGRFPVTRSNRLTGESFRLKPAAMPPLLLPRSQRTAMAMARKRRGRKIERCLVVFDFGDLPITQFPIVA
jgi:hypothetical protein